VKPKEWVKQNHEPNDTGRLPPYRTAEDLTAAARQLAKTDAIAFDLEADSMYHFQEKVCLIQIATEPSPLWSIPSNWMICHR
jgi:hypothetical protein